MPFVMRPTLFNDLPILAEYWYDKMVLRQQYNPYIRLSATAQEDWLVSAHAWLTTFPDLCMTTAIDTEIIGAVFGAVQNNLPGLLPVQIGLVHELVIDLHTHHNRQHSGTQLIMALREQLHAMQITELHIIQPLGMVVESAFWQSMNAKKYTENYWMQW